MVRFKINLGNLLVSRLGAQQNETRGGCYDMQRSDTIPVKI